MRLDEYNSIISKLREIESKVGGLTGGTILIAIMIIITWALLGLLWSALK